MNLNSIYNLGKSNNAPHDDSIVLTEMEVSKPRKRKSESVILPFLARYGYACVIGALAAITITMIMPEFMNFAYENTHTHWQAFRDAVIEVAKRYEKIGNGDYSDKFALGIPLVGASFGALLRKLQLAD